MKPNNRFHDARRPGGIWERVASPFAHWVILPALLTASAGAAAGGWPKRAPDLRPRNPDEQVDVIVRYRQSPGDTHLASMRNHGASVKGTIQLVRGIAARVPARALEALEADDDVEYVAPDRPVRAALDYAAPTVNAGLAQHYGYTGESIGIAVIDSGIGNHRDLTYSTGPASRVVYSESFVGRGAADGYGHGTHVAGILAGNGESSTGASYRITFRGIAPRALLINLRVLDDNGVGRDSDVIAAIERAIQLKKKYNIRVINLSLGRPVYESYRQDPLCQAVEAAWKAGIVVVVAAGNYGRDNSFGNEGYATITSPGNDPWVITVGAMKTMGTLTRGDDLIASYSSKGPTLIDHIVKPDLVAPGNRIISLALPGGTLLRQYPGNTVPLSYYAATSGVANSEIYYRLSGTSMATPVVSGAAALLLHKQPGLTPDQVKARLMKTASKSFPVFSVATDPVTGATYRSQYDIFTVGAGYLDIAAALASSEVAPAPAVSPTAVYDPATGNVYVVNGASAVWGSTAVWGTTAVWGSSVWLNGASAVWGSTALWGTSAVWGSGGTQGFSAVWGSTAVWGTSTKAESSGALLSAAAGVTTPGAVNVAIYGEN